MEYAPETKYVAVGEGDVAYQVTGGGSLDVLFGWGLGSHLELQWAHPAWAEGVLGRFASFSRLILFDRRGTGMSDRLPRSLLPPWEQWTEDILAVLDAAGSERASIVAVQDIGQMAMMFAAMHPERVRSLVLVGTAARLLVADDYPIGYPPEALDAMVEFIERNWGSRELLGVGNPSGAEDPEYTRWWGTMYRSAMTPRTAAAQCRHIFASDVRHALPLIAVPTIVVHWTDNPIVPLEHARYLVQHIEGARLVELSGTHLWPDPLDPDPFFDPVTEFLTGVRPAAAVDRVLTTVLFTDIVGSTELLATMGDDAWRRLLDTHDRLIREELRRHRGVAINTTGDGFFASFDGPTRAIRCAQAIKEAMAPLGIDLRAGLHTGECAVRGNDLTGLAVHIAARVGAAARGGEVLVSSTVADLVVGSGIAFEPRGQHELRGVPGSWELLAVAVDDGA